MKLKQITLTLLAFCLTSVFGVKAAAAVSLEVLADGLNNASGLSFGPDGSLYVGELGLGGDPIPLLNENGKQVTKPVFRPVLDDKGAPTFKNGELVTEQVFDDKGPVLKPQFQNCQPSPSTQFENICAGDTASVTKVSLDGKQERIFNGLESLALSVSKEQGSGPQGIQFDSLGNAYLLTGFAGFPGNRDAGLSALGKDVKLPPDQSIVSPPADAPLDTPSLGQLFKADLETGELTSIADLSKAELLDNPDGGDVISNPYNFVINRDTAYITDGGANVIWDVKLDGSSVEAIPLPKQTIENPVFPSATPPDGQQAGPGGDARGGQPGQANPPAGQPGQNPIPGTDEETPTGELPPGAAPPQLQAQSVPTGIAVGPDQALYVGEYSGFPFQEGSARIWRIGDDGKPEVYANGFTQITDLDFDEKGNLLVLQFANESQWKYNDGNSILDVPSSLIQLAPDGTRTTLVDAADGLKSATSVTVGPYNQIYMTNRGIGAGTGQVVRAVPEPSSILGVTAASALGVGSWLKRKRKLANGEKTLQKSC